MRGARMGMLASMIALIHGIAAPFRQAMALANHQPSPRPEAKGRNKVRKSSQRASGAAALKRAARKRACAPARAPKRKAQR